MADGPLRCQDQEGRLLSRQKYERPAGQAPAGFLLTSCGLHNSQFDPGSIYLTPLWHEADPTFLGWGHCIKIRVILHICTEAIIQVASVLFNYSCEKSLDASGIAGRRVQISNSPTRYFYTFQLFWVHLATKFAPPLEQFNFSSGNN